MESTAKEEKVLQAKRSACAAKIDERTLSAYERIRGNAHNHLAVVTLFPKNADGTYGDACGGCFHTITPQRILDIASGKKLVICEHCGRIIVITPQRILDIASGKKLVICEHCGRIIVNPEI